MIHGCHIHGLRWWEPVGRTCAVCRSERVRRERAEWRAKVLDQKCTELRQRLPPRQGTPNTSEQKAARLAVGKRALQLYAQGLPIGVICKRMGRSDNYVRQGMKEAREWTQD